jgi:hypothetical protein
MTALSLPTPRDGLLEGMHRDAPVLTALGALLTLSLVPTLAAMHLDDRLFQGDSIWLKPVKFQIALAIYVLTLAVYARWLPPSLRAARWFRVYIGIVTFAILAELVWIGGAAALGTASHFNFSTPLSGALYNLMGALAVTLTSASLVFGLAIWRNRETGLPEALRLSMALGLVLTFGLTVVVASAMSVGTGHLVGVPAPGDSGLPVLGWSRSAGDLRVAHFLATHALHALPLVGLGASLVLARHPARAVVGLAAAGYAALVLATFAQALAGLPLI